jgi:alkylhydroperoxidase family enzyme
MESFQIHTVESAPEGSKPALAGLKKNFGFIPNAAATMAESPSLINAFIGAFGSFHGGTLDEKEKQVVLLTNAVTFECEWTTAFHSTLALKSGVAERDVAAIRNGKLPQELKLAALSGMAKALIERKGHAIESDVARFLSAGYVQSQILEVIAGVAISTMAAFTANLANTPVEELFEAQAWKAA